MKSSAGRQPHTRQTYYIIPSIRMNDGLLGLRKTLNFSQENTSRLIQIGYDDAMRVLRDELIKQEEN